jgi:hypothetical protein
MQRALNATEMQGNEEDHDEPPVEQPVISPALLVQELEQQQQALDEGNPAEPEQLMNISFAAYNGCPSDSAISLILQTNKAQAIALADT